MMMRNVRIPAALSIVVAAGLALSLAIAAAGGACAYVSQTLAQAALAAAKIPNDGAIIAGLANLARFEHSAVLGMVVVSAGSVLLAFAPAVARGSRRRAAFPALRPFVDDPVAPDNPRTRFRVQLQCLDATTVQEFKDSCVDERRVAR